MRIHHFALMISLATAVAAPLSAQSAVTQAANQTHHVLKKVGYDAKADVKGAGSATHQVLRKAGNGTKTELGAVTGIHKVGGSVGSTAKAVSHAGKHVARKTKHGVKSGKAVVHRSLTKTGKSIKGKIRTY